MVCCLQLTTIFTGVAIDKLLLPGITRLLTGSHNRKGRDHMALHRASVYQCRHAKIFTL